MKKNGFISISVVYSFFLVFLTLLIFMVDNFVTNRALLNNLKNAAKDDISNTSFAKYLINNVSSSVLVHHDSSLVNGANDGSYRFVGSNPDNYVCLGSTAVSCPTDNLYRIIGVMNGKVKLIKVNGFSNLFSSVSENDYITSDIYTRLTNFYNGLTYKNMIEKSDWYYGRINYDSIINKNLSVKQLYDLEFTEALNIVSVSDYVALPYLSDFGYANANLNRTIDTRDNNWMVSLANASWTIRALAPYVIYSTSVDNSGKVVAYETKNVYGAHPVLFLKNSVYYDGGNGKSNNPYRLGGRS